MNVLVADDDPDIRDLVALRLELAGHAVTTVDNGGDALEALMSGAFDCAVLDVTMPVMTGVEVIARVRSDRAARDTRCVIMSALSLPQQRAAGLAAGADAYLSKPFAMSNLLAEVARAGGGDVVRTSRTG